MSADGSLEFWENVLSALPEIDPLDRTAIGKQLSAAKYKQRHLNSISEERLEHVGLSGAIVLDVVQAIKHYLSTRNRDEQKSYSVMVKLVRAVNLVAADKSGSSDAYAGIQVDDTEVKYSKVVRQSLNPEWNEFFNFSVPHVPKELFIRLYDKDQNQRDDRLGYVQIVLDRLVNEGCTFNGSINLENTAHGSVEVMVEVKESAAASSGDSGSHGGAGAQPKGKHIMISYQWDSQELVKQIHKELVDAGLPVWLDIAGGMKGNINEAMAHGVENAAVILPVLTQKYQESRNCQKELNYADQLKTPMVPIMAQDKWSQTGWLGAICAGMLWTDFRNSSNIKAAVQHLVQEIKNAAGDKLGAPVTEAKANVVKAEDAWFLTPVKDDWVGYYVQYGQQYEQKQTMSFSGTKVFGEGKDSIGAYTLSGSWEREGSSLTGAIAWKKQYIGAHAVDYEGTITKSGKRFIIDGRWSIGPDYGDAMHFESPEFPDA